MFDLQAGIELSSPLTKRSSTEAKKEANSIKYETTFFLRWPFAVKASFARSCFDRIHFPEFQVL